MDHEQSINYILLLLKTEGFCLALVEDNIHEPIIDKVQKDYKDRYVYIDIKNHINDWKYCNRGTNSVGWYKIFNAALFCNKLLSKDDEKELNSIINSDKNHDKFRKFLVTSFEILPKYKAGDTVIILFNIEYILDKESDLSLDEANQFFKAISDVYHKQSKLRFLLLGSQSSSNNSITDNPDKAFDCISRHTPQAKVEEVVKPPVTGSPSVVHSSQNNGENQDPISINHDNLSEKTKIDRKNWFHRVELFGIRMLSFGNHETSMSEKQKNVLLLVIPIAAIGLLIWLFSGSEKNGIPCWPPSKCITEPTTEPTQKPIIELTTEPTQKPIIEPTTEPTQKPIIEPTTEPTQKPIIEPTTEPTQEPIIEPTTEPTQEPIIEPTPTGLPACTKVKIGEPCQPL